MSASTTFRQRSSQHKNFDALNRREDYRFQGGKAGFRVWIGMLRSKRGLKGLNETNLETHEAHRLSALQYRFIPLAAAAPRPKALLDIPS
jgi:hypothetical protein